MITMKAMTKILIVMHLMMASSSSLDLNPLIKECQSKDSGLEKDFCTKLNELASLITQPEIIQDTEGKRLKVPPVHDQEVPQGTGGVETPKDTDRETPEETGKWITPAGEVEAFMKDIKKSNNNELVMTHWKMAEDIVKQITANIKLDHKMMFVVLMEEINLIFEGETNRQEEREQVEKERQEKTSREDDKCEIPGEFEKEEVDPDIQDTDDFARHVIKQTSLNFRRQRETVHRSLLDHIDKRLKNAKRKVKEDDVFSKVDIEAAKNRMQQIYMF